MRIFCMRCKPIFFSAIATSITGLVILPPAYPLPIPAWKISQQDGNPLPQTTPLIYVSPNPNPKGDGSSNNPYSSVTTALANKPIAGTVIQLQQGVYSAETGEEFPLRIPAGVTLRGEPTVRGINTVIKGGGKFISPSFASQNITVLTDNGARIEGLTITNPNTRGTAVWVESSKQVAVSNNTFINSDREGVFLTGNAEAIVDNNLFKKNGANGLSAVGSSTGDIRNNTFESTGFGLAIGQKSQVTVSNNNILNNTDGIIISNLSAPTLRNNLITDSQRNGVVILKDRKGYPTPDLGTSTSLGKNIFRNNLGKDLNNNSGVTQVAVGNELDPTKIAGDIAFVGEAPTTPAPQTPTQPFVPATTSALPSVNGNSAITNPTATTNTGSSNGNTGLDSVEITRSPQPSFNRPVTPPTALAPSKSSIFIEPLPEVPAVTSSQLTSTQTTSAQTPPDQSATTIPPSNNSIKATVTPSSKISQNPNEILIDRDPIPVIPPQPVTPPRSQFIPNDPPAQTPPVTPTTPTVIQTPVPYPVPYNAKLAALVPPPAKDTTPYLVVIPSADDEILNRVRSAVPSARIIPSRFGNIIMVQGYPDRDRAEVLKTLMRSAIGVDARVVYQGNL
ncbi:DUF1565 domain-containing protein [Pseudanabaena sp. UWO310]|nr:DUF1565 domain-containing protein [Pseudanabaena sp. UWO310]